jgi:hypothetical protein
VYRVCGINGCGRQRQQQRAGGENSAAEMRRDFKPGIFLKTLSRTWVSDKIAGTSHKSKRAEKWPNPVLPEQLRIP